MYESLEIKQNHFGGIDVPLDGEPLKGCKSASLELGVECVPFLTVTVMVKDVNVSLNKRVEVFTSEEPFNDP